jgi:hypothetical protein
LGRHNPQKWLSFRSAPTLIKAAPNSDGAVIAKEILAGLAGKP